MDVFSCSWTQLFTVASTVVVFWGGCVLLRSVRRLYFHPLSIYPGPVLAATSLWHKAFIECVLERSWETELQAMHARYGPVVRVRPNELHFSDPEAYLDIYQSRNRWDKEKSMYHGFGEDQATFCTLSYQDVKKRREALNRIFSAQAVRQAEGLIQEKVNILCDGLERRSRANLPSDFNMAFRGLTADVITHLCYGKSINALGAENFQAPLLLSMDACLPTFIAFKHWQLYMKMIMNCPPRIARIVSPPISHFLDFQEMLRTQIDDLVEHPEKLDKLPHNMTIYHTLLDRSAYKSGWVPDKLSIFDESQSLMFAGTDTVGSTLMVAMYHLLKSPVVMDQLKAEVRSIWLDISGPPPSSKELEALPYLTACCKEGLRMCGGVVAGLPRVVPPGGAQIAGQLVPQGTVVSVAHPFVHYHPRVFPDPHVFQPERWIQNPGLDTYLVAFSKGPRACTGAHLAWSEMRIALASLVRKFEIALHPSSPEELVYRDCFVPFYGGRHAQAIFLPAVA